MELDTANFACLQWPAVNGDSVRKFGRERLASEMLTHLDHLYRTALFLAKSDADAQDCVQETCARALGAYDQFTGGTNLKAWLTRILYNYFFDSAARHKRMVSTAQLSDEAEEQRDYLDTVASDDPGPDQLFMQRELGAKIRSALGRIPEEFRAPIVLVDMGDCSYQEAAEILRCPIGTVRSRLSRGRKLLQSILGDYLT
jgi:RNA polymerase sigma-70 factor (ECF subfamily)